MYFAIALFLEKDGGKYSCAAHRANVGCFDSRIDGGATAGVAALKLRRPGVLRHNWHLLVGEESRDSPRHFIFRSRRLLSVGFFGHLVALRAGVATLEQRLPGSRRCRLGSFSARRSTRN